MTAARPTSEPVPAVVGTATTGAMPSTFDARVPVLAILEIQERPRLARPSDAIALPTSSALPPPNAMTPSCAPAAIRRHARASRCPRPDSPAMSQNTAHSSPASRTTRTASAIIGSRASAGIGDDAAGAAMPSVRQASGSSRDAAGAEADRGRVVPVAASASCVTSFRSRPQVKRFRPRQVLVADTRQRAAAAGILDADPGERRVEIVAAVHEPGAGVDALADRKCRVRVFASRSRRSGRSAVVHELDGFLVATHLHDAGDRAEDLLAHDAHRVIDVRAAPAARDTACPRRLAANSRFVDRALARRLRRDAAICARICRRPLPCAPPARASSPARWDCRARTCRVSVDAAVDECLVEAARARRCAGCRSRTGRN